MLKNTNRNVSVGKAEPLQQKSPCYANAHLIRAPCLQSISGVLLDQGEALTGRFVDVLTLSNLFEYPLQKGFGSANRLKGIV